jgi:hypothetical protein
LRLPFAPFGAHGRDREDACGGSRRRPKSDRPSAPQEADAVIPSWPCPALRQCPEPCDAGAPLPSGERAG